MAWKHLKDKEVATYYPIGSDFGGYVEAVGKNVKQFQIGDLVIANCNYPDIEQDEAPGIPSNHSSREFEVYHPAKLIKVPDFISDVEAGSLSIGTQTSHAMVRKAEIQKGQNVLVTSITSNTSFFVLNNLWEKNCNVYGLSYSGENIDTVTSHFPFIKKVFSVQENSIPQDLVFDVVFDAFSDTYLPYLAPKLNLNAKYITCGIYNQSTQKIRSVEPVNLSGLIATMMARNVSFIGNCLGNSQDLMEGLKQYKTQKMVIDSVFTVQDELADFIQRSYNVKKNKFGKVVFVYTDN